MAVRKLFEIEYKCKSEIPHHVHVPYIYRDQIFKTTVIGKDQDDAEKHFEQYYPLTSIVNIKELQVTNN